MVTVKFILLGRNVINESSTIKTFLLVPPRQFTTCRARDKFYFEFLTDITLCIKHPFGLSMKTNSFRVEELKDFDAFLQPIVALVNHLVDTRWI